MRLLVGALVAFLAACTNKPVTTQAIEFAQEACKPHGGLRSVQPGDDYQGRIREYTAYCAGSTRVTYRIREDL